MSETNNHPWSRDPVAQAAVRAAEDDAANWRRLEVGEVIEAGDQHMDSFGFWRPVTKITVGRAYETHSFAPHCRRRVPPPDHRELPGAVAELRERVARLEDAKATIGSGDVFRDVGCGSTGDEIVRLTAERDAALRERDAARARVAELESAPNTAPAANAGGEAKQEPVAWGVLIDSGRGLYGHYDFESEARGVCEAVNAEEGWAMTVVPLYTAPVAESATTPQPPRGWLTEEERACIEELLPYTFSGEQTKALTALLARSTPPMVRRPTLDDLDLEERPVWESACDVWIAAIREAGGEVE